MNTDHVAISALDNAKYIQEHLSADDIYTQLAEEAAELSQAASKYVRILNGNNPSPKTIEEAGHDVVEEFTDVVNVAINVLGIKPDWFIGDYKLYRWRKRLEQKDGCGPDYCDI